MSVQGLLQKGTQNCSKLERAADAILSFPRLMWLGREIKLDTKEKELKIVDDQAKSFSRLMNESATGGHEEGASVFICLSVFFLLGSLLAAPLLGIGLACKKIALIRDPKANSFHQMMELAPKATKLNSEKLRLMEANKYLDKEIEAEKRVKTCSENIQFFEERKQSNNNRLLKISQIWQPIHNKIVKKFQKFNEAI